MAPELASTIAAVAAYNKRLGAVMPAAARMVVKGAATLYLADSAQLIPVLRYDAIITDLVPGMSSQMWVWDKIRAVGWRRGKPLNELLKAHPEWRTILDPYMGHCNVGRAVIEASRKFIGIECDKGIFNEVCRNMENDLPWQ